MNNIQDCETQSNKDAKGEAMINGYGCTKEQYLQWVTAPLCRQIELEQEWKILWRKDYPYKISKVEEFPTSKAVPEYTGGSVSYYTVSVRTPMNPNSIPYNAECQDIINALKLDFNEGSAFKAIWRRAAARQGKQKRGYDNGLYDAEKVEFYGNQMKRTTPVAPQEGN